MRYQWRFDLQNHLAFLHRKFDVRFEIVKPGVKCRSACAYKGVGVSLCQMTVAAVFVHTGPGFRYEHGRLAQSSMSADN